MNNTIDPNNLIEGEDFYLHPKDTSVLPKNTI